MSTVETPPTDTTLPPEEPKRRPKTGLLVGIAVAVIALGVLAYALFFSGGGEEAEIRELLLANIEAENNGDAETFLAGVTDEFLESYDVGTREEIESGEAELGRDQIEDVEIVEVTIDGDTAAATIDGTIDGTRMRAGNDLIQVDGEWKVNGFRFPAGMPEVPAGIDIVDLTLEDYAFNADPAELSEGFGGVSFTNAGSEAHEVAIVGITDESLTGDKLLETLETVEDPSNLPEGLSVAHFLGFSEPGGEGGAYLTAGNLEAGRYAMLCMIPSEDGTPHAFKGMLAEFEIAG